MSDDEVRTRVSELLDELAEDANENNDEMSYERFGSAGRELAEPVFCAAERLARHDPHLALNLLEAFIG